MGDHNGEQRARMATAVVANAVEAEADLIEAEVPRANAPWCHSPKEPKPERFFLGPLTDTAVKLDAAICARKKPDRNHRQLNARGTDGRLWIVRLRRTCLEVWFSDQASYTAAKRRLGQS